MSEPVILAAVDGSENALVAAGVAARFAQLLGGRMGLVTALQIAGDSLAFGGGLLVGDLKNRLLEEARTAAEDNMRGVAERLQEQCRISMPEFFLREGSPEHEIPKLVQENPDVAMVIVGKQGYGTESRPRGLPHFLGGLGGKLSAALPVPVLIVPPDIHPELLCAQLIRPKPSQEKR